MIDFQLISLKPDVVVEIAYWTEEQHQKLNQSTIHSEFYAKLATASMACMNMWSHGKKCLLVAHVLIPEYKLVEQYLDYVYCS